MPKRRHPRRTIGSSRRPKGGVPMPEGGYALPVGRSHARVYVTSVTNEHPDLRRLARLLVDVAKEELGRRQLTGPDDEPEPESCDQSPSPRRLR
jgi:hypothetical protein